MNPALRANETGIKTGRKITGRQYTRLSYHQRPVRGAPDHDSDRAALASLPAELPPKRRRHVLGAAVAYRTWR